MIRKAALFFGVLFSVTAALLLCSFASPVYMAPRRDVPPVVDGAGDDEAWEDALVIKLDASVNDAFDLSVENAYAEVRIVWSNADNAKGLYVLWNVSDPSPCEAMTYNSADINAQDCVQIFLDPFYKRFDFVQDCAMCFTFAPYTSPVVGSGKSYGAPCWREYWYWKGGMIKAVGIKTATTLVFDGDVIKGYCTEAFIPFSAMAINDRTLTVKEYETRIGMGLAMIDYGAKPSRNGSVTERKFVSMTSDFCRTTSQLSLPSQYGTLYFGADYLPGLELIAYPERRTDVIVPGEVSRAALDKAINSTSRLKSSMFTVDSWSAMNKAYAAALIAVNDGYATQEEIDRAERALTESLLALQYRDTSETYTTYEAGRTLKSLTWIAVFIAGAVLLASVTVFIFARVKK